MITLTTEEQDELMERDDMSVHSSLYAYSAYWARYDETPLDSLVRSYYLYLPATAA